MDLDNLTDDQAKKMLDIIAKQIGFNTALIDPDYKNVCGLSTVPSHSIVYLAFENEQDDCIWWEADNYREAIEKMLKHSRITSPGFSPKVDFKCPSLEELKILIDIA